VLGVAALACVLVALSLLHGLTLTAAAAPAIAAEGGAEPFSEARLAALREAGRPVFVDMSAAWCITCLVNERVALDPASVRDAFAGHHVALLRGDWTRRDAAITRYLDHFGRNGVPLYVYYPAGGTPKVLPQILTPGLVTDLVGGSA
jgi:thiol:disulfide interchange protein DsbD